MRFLGTMLEIVFPSHCLACGESGADLCLSCLREAPAAERESAKWIFPLYDYRHPTIKKSLLLLKYGRKKRLTKIFGEVLYEKILEELSELSIMENFIEPIIVPIPLAPKRYRERGYNQAELLCREIERLNELRSGPKLYFQNNILLKPKDTPHQARIKDRTTRLKNLSGSFTVKHPELIQKKNIILIDDILTTGATLGEARKTLKQAGARKIVAFTLAH